MKPSKTLITLALSLLTVYAVFLIFFYQANTNYAIETKKSDLQKHLIFQSAMRHYIENFQKPVIYNLQRNGTLGSDFFDPSILSSSYITRQTNNKYSELLLENNLPEFKHNLVSDNALNPINNGTKEELALLEYFNQHPDIKQVDKVIHQNNKTYLYVAIPVSANKTSCLHCHGNPSDAPKQLIERYGTEHGFNEKLGHKRAFISFTVSLSESLDSARQFFYLIAAATLIGLLIIFVGFSYFYRRIAKSNLLIESQNTQLYYLANHDQLTGCYNRHYLQKTLPSQLEKLSKMPEKSLCAILIDLDHFKKINDEHGHDMGDLVLKNTTKTIEQTLGNNGTLYRIGGEEFIIIFTDTTPSKVTEWLDNLYLLLTQVKQADTFNSVITISAGITFAQSEDSQHSLLKRADQAMYLAKQAGRNQYKYL